MTGAPLVNLPLGSVTGGRVLHMSRPAPRKDGLPRKAVWRFRIAVAGIESDGCIQHTGRVVLSDALAARGDADAIRWALLGIAVRGDVDHNGCDPLPPTPRTCTGRN